MALDCQSCGACCFGDTPRYVPVTGDDHQRLGVDAERLTYFEGTKCYMVMREGHCAALSFDAARGGFVCDVYERRPETCRELERGSSACEVERERKEATARAFVGENDTSSGMLHGPPA